MVTRTRLNVTFIRTLSCDFSIWYLQVNDNMASIMEKQLLFLWGSMIQECCGAVMITCTNIRTVPGSDPVPIIVWLSLHSNFSRFLSLEQTNGRNVLAGYWSCTIYRMIGKYIYQSEQRRIPQVVGSISTCTRIVAARLATTLSSCHILSHLQFNLFISYHYVKWNKPLPIQSFDAICL
jgi:hypothetical protein